jgi:colicin import membrane protein
MSSCPGVARRIVGARRIGKEIPVFRRDVGAVPDGAGASTSPRGLAGRPNLAGDLDTLLDRPLFRPSIRGYDRLQVDNYVSWAESEILAGRRENDDLLSRYGVCSAELEIARRLLACSPAGREQLRTSDRVGEILRLAADEAAQLSEAGATEGDRLRAEARAEADLVLRRAAQVKDAAVTESRRMDEETRQIRGEAAAVLQAARAEAADIRAEALAERDRVASEALAERDRVASEALAERDRLAVRAEAEVSAACAARVAAARVEIEDLLGRREQARLALHRLTGQLGDALGTLSTLLADEDIAGREEHLVS